MKKIVKKKNKNYIFFPIILVIIMVCFVSMGWSAFTHSLNVSDLAFAVRPHKDIRITNLSIPYPDSFETNGTIIYAQDYNVHHVNLSLDLPNNNSQIKYKIEITNLGNVIMGIRSINGLPENLEYELVDYQLKNKICVDDVCKNGIQKDIYLIIRYRDGGYQESSTQYNFSLDFDFRPIYQVSYQNFPDTSSYPKEIMEEEDLVVTIQNEIEMRYVTVFVKDVKTNYNFNDHTIKLEKVPGDVLIRNNNIGQYVLELGDGRKCSFDDDTYGAVTRDVISTDSPCDGAGGHWDEPPYHTYLSGTNACLDFNYVWYSGYMWRITEILNNGSVKMITENVLSAMNFGPDGFFDNSYIKMWLNEDFLDTLYNHDKILVEDATWDISPFYDWCYIKPPNTTEAPVGLLNSYEFNKTVNYGSDSFLNLGHNWWFSSYINLEAPYTAVSGSSLLGGFAGWEVPNTAFGVRPMVVLKVDVKFSGTGTENDPFVLLDDIPNAIPGEKINERTPGELVEINDMLYRIVNIHKQDGKLVTKLKSANYVKDDNGDVILKQFGDMHMSTYGAIVDSKNDDYWGAYLNNTWLQQQGIEKYLVKDTYYLNPAQDSKDQGSIIGSYKNTTCAEINTKDTIKDCKKTTNTWTGYVGLPIVGELFSHPLGGNDVHNYITATMTPYGDDGYLMIGAFEPDRQGVFQHTHDEYFAVRPTITLNEDVIIESGDGKTPATAYKIALS